MRADVKSGHPEWWRTHPWRLIQTNLREIDMEDIDAELYVRELVSMRATIAMINVGGIIASYPTTLHDHFQSPFLSGDSLSRIISACHDAGIRVIARNDFSKIRRAVYERHPDWAYRTRSGEIVDYNGDVHACLNGGYQQEYAFRIVTEMLEVLDIDGVFFNMGGFQVRDYSYNHYGPCHCDACVRRFSDRFSTSLRTATAQDAPAHERRRYELAKREWVTEHENRMHLHIRERRPDVAVNHYEFMRQESNTEIGRALPRWQYSASSNTRWAVAGDPTRISSNTSVDFIGFYYRHVAVSPAMQELRLWQNLANGGALDYYLIGRLDNHRDRSGFERVKKVFSYHEANEPIYTGRALRSLAPTLLVRPRGALSDEAKGWIRLLTEFHVPFDEVRAGDLNKVDLSSGAPMRYSHLILPDVEELSAAECERLNAWVASGGLLIATGHSGLIDQRLEPRLLPGVDLGISRIAALRTDMRSSMFAVPHGLFVRLDASGSELLYVGDRYLAADYRAEADPFLRLIPPHHYGPPERCYDTQITDLPGLVRKASGAGSTFYLPWWPGALYHREGHLNTALFVGDLLCGYTNIPAVRTNAGPMVEVTVHRLDAEAASARSVTEMRSADATIVVSLVNTSGHFGTTVHEPVTVSDVSVVVPAALVARALGMNSEVDGGLRGEHATARSLVDDRTIPCGSDDGLVLTVGRLQAFDAILVSLSRPS